MKMPVPYEPKMKNRWLIKFKGNYKGIQPWLVSKTSRPKWRFYDDIKNLNNANSFDYEGSWDDIEIYLRDSVHTSNSKILMNAIRLVGKGKNKIKYNLELLDNTGVTIEKWRINGKVKEFNFGDLDYSDDSLVEIKMVIKPTKVKLDY